MVFEKMFDCFEKAEMTRKNPYFWLYQKYEFS